MNYNVTYTNIQPDRHLEEYLKPKTERINRLLGMQGSEIFAGHLQAEFGKETRHHNKGHLFFCELNFRVPGAYYRARATKEDMYAAIDMALDKLGREIGKGKRRGWIKDKIRNFKAMVAQRFRRNKS